MSLTDARAASSHNAHFVGKTHPSSLSGSGPAISIEAFQCHVREISLKPSQKLCPPLATAIMSAIHAAAIIEACSRLELHKFQSRAGHPISDVTLERAVWLRAQNPALICWMCKFRPRSGDSKKGSGHLEPSCDACDGSGISTSGRFGDCCHSREMALTTTTSP